MYITEALTYNTETNRATLTLIWKTPDDVFPYGPTRYRNNKPIAGLLPTQFKYKRRGEYLVGTAGPADAHAYKKHWEGVGEWRIDPKIRGNVRGCC